MSELPKVERPKDLAKLPAWFAGEIVMVKTGDNPAFLVNKPHFGRSERCVVVDLLKLYYDKKELRTLSRTLDELADVL